MILDMIIWFLCIIVGVAIAFCFLLIKYPHFLKSKKKYAIAIKSEKNINKVIDIIPKLTGEEREFLISFLFGRTIRLQKTVSPMGECWLEMAGAACNFEDEEEVERSEVG